MISDIDEPRSHIGRPFFFLAIPINKIFGHRTLTHSLLFTIALGLILWTFMPHSYVYAIVAGVIAHIVGDMVTGKVKLFYPLPVSVGITVPQAGYLLIDRVTRIGLGIVVLWLIGGEALQYIKNTI